MHDVPNQHKEEAALALVTIAASAGGLGPLLSLVKFLPDDFPAAVVIACHSGPFSLLVDLLASRARLPVTYAETGALVRPGRIYVCPPERHVAVGPDARLAVSARERLNYWRPCGNWLFESAAASFRERTIGVVLSGMQCDGAQGSAEIRRAGGRMIVQDPKTCLYPDMPLAALDAGRVDSVVPIDALGPAVVDMVREMNLDRCRECWEEPFVAMAS